MIIDDFGGLCLTNAHLALDPRGFSRRFAPQNDNGYVFTLLHMCISPHLRITTIPYYHVRNVTPTNNGRPFPFHLLIIECGRTIANRCYRFTGSVYFNGKIMMAIASIFITFLLSIPPGHPTCGRCFLIRLSEGRVCHASPISIGSYRTLGEGF